MWLKRTIPGVLVSSYCDISLDKVAFPYNMETKLVFIEETIGLFFHETFSSVLNGAGVSVLYQGSVHCCTIWRDVCGVPHCVQYCILFWLLCLAHIDATFSVYYLKAFSKTLQAAWRYGYFYCLVTSRKHSCCCCIFQNSWKFHWRYTYVFSGGKRLDFLSLHLTVCIATRLSLFLSWSKKKRSGLRCSSCPSSCSRFTNFLETWLDKASSAWLQLRGCVSLS